ncbi:bifunctional DNA primase/polymerase [Saccharopolyspora sp. HNM0983]|uniref:Bifunctional DNA primase/polymerase n=1 Tax=Saccharopolyspora montiporae TaxID=2781240 RepID=A0A929G2A6_9PSEU|nr:bifunctional DNA primase/polymerase [Saccharopolyspora sp. HNM0983]MBE9375578.1 bifunctional DNA primase/polymerase [Saccharopolyspora sp. HNM0983]
MTTTSATAQTRDWALCLADLGWHVFPLRPGTKTPALHGHRTCPGTGICADEHQGWEQRATTHLTRVRTCWSSGGYNIAIATGPSGLLVVDCDQPGHEHRMPDRWATLGIRTGTEVLGRVSYM